VTTENALHSGITGPGIRFREHEGAFRALPRTSSSRPVRFSVSEIVALDIDDVARSARKGVLRIRGKGERVRHVPIHPQLRAAIAG
jgi:integrase